MLHKSIREPCLSPGGRMIDKLPLQVVISNGLETEEATTRRQQMSIGWSPRAISFFFVPDSRENPRPASVYLKTAFAQLVHSHLALQERKDQKTVGTNRSCFRPLSRNGPNITDDPSIMSPLWFGGLYGCVIAIVILLGYQLIINFLCAVKGL